MKAQANRWIGKRMIDLDSCEKGTITRVDAAKGYGTYLVVRMDNHADLCRFDAMPRVARKLFPAVPRRCWRIAAGDLTPINPKTGEPLA